MKRALVLVLVALMLLLAVGCYRNVADGTTRHRTDGTHRSYTNDGRERVIVDGALRDGHRTHRDKARAFESGMNDGAHYGAGRDGIVRRDTRQDGIVRHGNRHYEYDITPVTMSA